MRTKPDGKTFDEFWGNTPRKDRWFGCKTFGGRIELYFGRYRAFADIYLGLFERERDAKLAVEERLRKLSREEFSIRIGVPVLGGYKRNFH